VEKIWTIRQGGGKRGDRLKQEIREIIGDEVFKQGLEPCGWEGGFYRGGKKTRGKENNQIRISKREKKGKKKRAEVFPGWPGMFP